MGKKLYLEGFSGISGDMTVAALLDLGGSREKLAEALANLQLSEEFSYTITRGNSHGIAGCSFNVCCHKVAHHHHEHHEHHHDHEHHDHEHDHEHHHEHTHEHHHEHIHRNIHDVMQIVKQAKLTFRAYALTGKIFEIVAQAEAQAHGLSVDEVHFHEVGAIDSIVDIVSAAVLIDDLDITECVVEALSEGSGSVRCQHGVLPVPVPAVLNIAAAHNIALRKTAVQGEMVTPTGIAIAAALRSESALPEKYTIKKIGIGVGKRDFGHANILRAMFIEEAASPEKVWVLESNIDDCTGEMLGLAMEKLFSAGALDVNYTPCFMKKNRPGYLLRVVAQSSNINKLEALIFENTTTIGIRRYAVERSCMERTVITVATPYGEALVKKCVSGNITRFYPEYESVKMLAEKADIDFRTVYQAVEHAADCNILQ